MMNISHQEVESIYQIVSGNGEKKVEQLAKKKEQLEAVEKELDKLRDRRNKLKAEIKTMEYSLNASKHSNMVGELENFGIDLEDKETL
jgi:cell division protein FtsB